jgi:hypothetical protein
MFNSSSVPRQADPDPIVQAKLHDIARRYAWTKSRRRCGGPFYVRALVRMREIERVLASRCGRTLPDDDAGREDLRIAAHHVRDVAGNIVKWARLWAPWCTEHEAQELAEDVIREPRRWKADTIAWVLGVTMAERTALKLTTIGAVGTTSETRAAEHRARKAERQAARRRAAGATPRAQYEAGSVERARPWESQGISRRTWFRRRGTGAKTADSFSGAGTHLCQVTTRQEKQDVTGSVDGALNAKPGLAAAPRGGRSEASHGAGRRQRRRRRLSLAEKRRCVSWAVPVCGGRQCPAA